MRCRCFDNTNQRYATCDIKTQDFSHIVYCMVNPMNGGLRIKIRLIFKCRNYIKSVYIRFLSNRETLQNCGDHLSIAIQFRVFWRRFFLRDSLRSRLLGLCSFLFHYMLGEWNQNEQFLIQQNSSSIINVSINYNHLSGTISVALVVYRLIGNVSQKSYIRMII